MLILQKGKGGGNEIFAFGNATADFVAGHLDNKILFTFGLIVRHLNISLYEMELRFQHFCKNQFKLKLKSRHFDEFLHLIFRHFGTCLELVSRHIDECLLLIAGHFGECLDLIAGHLSEGLLQLLGDPLQLLLLAHQLVLQSVNLDTNQSNFKFRLVCLTNN